jgi:hypothetical protein
LGLGDWIIMKSLSMAYRAVPLAKPVPGCFDPEKRSLGRGKEISPVICQVKKKKNREIPAMSTATDRRDAEAWTAECKQRQGGNNQKIKGKSSMDSQQWWCR